MDFVDDVHLGAQIDGGKLHVFAQLPNFVDAAVRRRVDFHYVQGSASGDGDTGGASKTRFCCYSEVTVEGPRHNLGHGGFACATRPGEQQGMRHTASLQHVA